MLGSIDIYVPENIDEGRHALVEEPPKTADISIASSVMSMAATSSKDKAMDAAILMLPFPIIFPSV